MSNTKVNFSHAFERWSSTAQRERKRLDEELRQGNPVTSWEALDHLCGLAAESGIKALLFHIGSCKADESGDFPLDSSGRRPHIDQLWDRFERSVQGHAWVHIWKKLGAPPGLFANWEVRHRYAPDGTVEKSNTLARADFLKKLHHVLAEEAVF